MSKLAGFVALALLLALACCSATAKSSTLGDNGNSLEFSSRKRSLCNTFGGCGAARSIKAGDGPPRLRMAAAPYSRHQEAGLKLPGRPPASGRSAAGPPSGLNGLRAPLLAHQQQQQQQQQQGDRLPLELVMRPPRVGRLLEDPAALESLGRGLGMRHRRQWN